MRFAAVIQQWLSLLAMPSSPKRIPSSSACWMKRLRVLSWSYTATVILVTVVVMQTYGLWNQRVGAFQERAERRAIADSLLGVELLEHTDSIVAAIALQTVFLYLYRRDSLVRARRAECGPLVVC